MSDAHLRDRLILFVEDEYVIAGAMQRSLEQTGAHVVGPVATVHEALALIASQWVDLAILDVNLGEEKVFPVADALSARGIPFAFATGYSAPDLPPAWRHVARFEKSVDATVVARACR